MCILLSLILVVGRQLVEQLRVELHESLEHTVYKRHNCLIPVFFRYSIECGEHDWEDDVRILFDHAHDVFVVPVVQGSLGDL